MKKFTLNDIIRIEVELDKTTFIMKKGDNLYRLAIPSTNTPISSQERKLMGPINNFSE